MRYPNVTWRIVLYGKLFTTELRHTCTSSNHQLHFADGLPLYPSKSNMDDGRHLANRYDVITLPRMVEFRWNLVDDIESHADDDGNVKLETRTKFQYGDHLFSETGNSNVSRGFRYLVEIWYAHRLTANEKFSLLIRTINVSLMPWLHVK